MSESRGWISLHRKITESEVWKDIFKHRLWEICLLKATHDDYEQMVGNQIIKLTPGQFVTGRKALAEEFNQSVGEKYSVSEKTAERWLEFFEKSKMVTIKKTNKYSIVTILNWDKYQKNDQQMTNKCPTNDQQMTTNNNINNINKKPSRLKYEICDTENATLLLKLIKENNPDCKSPNLEKWANDIRIMREKDNRTTAQVKYLIEWSQQDDFWKTNILSPSSLRRNFDKLVVKVKAEKEKKVIPMKQASGSSQYKPFVPIHELD